MSVKERMRDYISSTSMTVSDFEKSLGVSNGYINSISRNIGIDKLNLIIEKYSNLNIEWLLSGKGEMIKHENNPRNKTTFKSKELNGIPLIPTSAMAGFFSGSTQILEFECDRFVVPVFKDAEFLIQVKGSSMVPKYNSGDIVACKRMPIDTFFQWNKVYVLDTEQGALIKRIQKGETPETLSIVSENSNYPPFELHRSKIYNIALVIGVIRLE